MNDPRPAMISAQPKDIQPHLFGQDNALQQILQPVRRADHRAGAQVGRQSANEYSPISKSGAGTGVVSVNGHLAITLLVAQR